jgi:glycerol kinase
MYNIYEKSGTGDTGHTGRPRGHAAEVVDSSGVVGLTDADVTGAPYPSRASRETAGGAVRPACFDAGQAKNTYGTGCFCCSTWRRAVEPASGLILTLACDEMAGPVTL